MLLFKKIQKSTLQIGEEDHLRKGDILFNINGEQLAYKNKFELISKLSSLGGIAEVSVLRKTNSNCFGANIDQVPYHNGIFAQNSIKLAMRKYEKPSMKCNSEAELLQTPTENQAALNSNEDVANETINENEPANQNNELIESCAQSNVPTNDDETMIAINDQKDADDDVDQETTLKNDIQQDNTAKNHDIKPDATDKTNPTLQADNTHSKQTLCANSGSILTSYHSDNWLFYDKRPLVPDPIESTNETNLDLTQVQNTDTAANSAVDEKQKVDDDENAIVVKVDESTETEAAAIVNELTANSCNKLNHTATGAGSQILKTSEPISSFDFDECTARSLTSSSCHSERSIIHLNCVVCFEDENGNNYAGLKTEAANSKTSISKSNAILNKPTSIGIDINFDHNPNGNDGGQQAQTAETGKNQPNDLQILHKQVEQIKENLKKESYQRFDDLKEDDGGIEIVNKHNITHSPMQTESATDLKAVTATPLSHAAVATTILIQPIISVNVSSPGQPGQITSSSSSFLPFALSNNIDVNKCKSPDPVFNKYVSSCQIEIKNPIKNYTSVPNLKFIKFNVNTDKSCAKTNEKVDCPKATQVALDEKTEKTEDKKSAHDLNVVEKSNTEAMQSNGIEVLLPSNEETQVNVNSANDDENNANITNTINTMTNNSVTMKKSQEFIENEDETLNSEISKSLTVVEASKEHDLSNDELLPIEQTLEENEAASKSDQLESDLKEVNLIMEEMVNKVADQYEQFEIKEVDSGLVRSESEQSLADRDLETIRNVIDYLLNQVENKAAHQNSSHTVQDNASNQPVNNCLSSFDNNPRENNGILADFFPILLVLF